MPRLPRTLSSTAGLALLLALLGACGTARAPLATVAYWRMAPAAERDPELERYLDRRLLEIAPAGPAAASVLMRPPGLRAEWREPGVVLVWTDLLLRVSDDAELAFVLAHEVGHAVLGHAAAAADAHGPDPDLEPQADRWARERIAAMGHRADAGSSLLRALAAELGGDPARADARAAIERRLAALDALPPIPSQPATTADGPWLELQRERRAAWATQDPSLRDPARAAQVRARWH